MTRAPDHRPEVPHDPHPEYAWLVAEVRRRRAVEAARRAESTSNAPSDPVPAREYIAGAITLAERRVLFARVTRYVRAYLAASARMRGRGPTIDP